MQEIQVLKELCPYKCDLSPPYPFCNFFSPFSPETWQNLHFDGFPTNIQQVSIYDVMFPVWNTTVCIAFPIANEILASNIGIHTIVEGSLRSCSRNLRQLTLTRNNLTKITVAAFEGLTNLKILSLDRNELTEIVPNAFATLKNLEKLTLDYNKFTEIAPGTFKGYTKLKILSLNHNGLTEIVPSTFEGLINLKSLLLDHNKLIKIGSFDGLNLETLSLSYNNLTEIAPGTFNAQANLRFLSLRHNNLSFFSENLVEGLWQVQQLLLEENKFLRINVWRVYARCPNLFALGLNDRGTHVRGRAWSPATRTTLKMKVETTTQKVPLDDVRRPKLNDLWKTIQPRWELNQQLEPSYDGRELYVDHINIGYRLRNRTQLSFQVVSMLSLS